MSMPRNDDGEFELVMGNKQLLSVFGIVVVLLGIFFTMGYIVGRNSSPAEPIAIASAGSAETGSPAAVEVPPASAERPTVIDPAPAGNNLPIPDSVPIEPPVAPKSETKQAKAKPAPAERPAPPAPVAAPAVVDQVPSGTYWQIAAVKRPEAELLVEMLVKKGFTARFAPGPSDLFRVLVGPAADTAALSKLKTELQAAGYSQPLVRKY